MKRMILFCGLLCVLAITAETRDWGFGKDTVYESSSGGDAVWLINQGQDTLKIDSLFIENINAIAWYYVRFYYSPQGVPSREYDFFQFHDSVRSVSDGEVPPLDSAMFEGFNVSAGCLAKWSNGDAQERDSLSVRLRLQATTGESDSLILKGYHCGSSSLLRLKGIDARERVKGGNRDPLGRKAKPVRGPFFIE